MKMGARNYKLLHKEEKEREYWTVGMLWAVCSSETIAPNNLMKESRIYLL